RLGIRNRDLGFECAVVETLPSFGDLHLIAMRPTAIRIGISDPCPFIVTVGLDHKRVAVPMTDIPSIPVRLRRLGRKLSSVGPDRSPGVGDFPELKYAVGKHDEFKSVVIGMQPWPSRWVAIHWRARPLVGVLAMKNFTGGILRTDAGCMLLLPP